MDPHLRHTFTCVVVGPTGCGKSTLIKNIIAYLSELIDPVPKWVVWFYGEWQPMCETFYLMWNL